MGPTGQFHHHLGLGHAQLGRALEKPAPDLARLRTVQELYGYVEREVAQRSRAVGGRQYPVLKGELEGPLPLVLLAR